MRLHRALPQAQPTDPAHAAFERKITALRVVKELDCTPGWGIDAYARELLATTSIRRPRWTSRPGSARCRTIWRRWAGQARHQEGRAPVSGGSSRLRTASQTTERSRASGSLIDEGEQRLRDLPTADLIDALYTELQAVAGQPLL
jgi:hypothetical protein